MLALLTAWLGFYQTSLREQAIDTVGRLRADGQPVLDAIFAENETVFIAVFEHWVVGAQALNVAAIARHAGIRNNHAVIRAILGTTTGQADFQRHNVDPFIFYGVWRPTYWWHTGPWDLRP